MNVLVIAEHWPVASGRYALDALRRLGHDARSAGPTHEPPNAIWGGTVDDRYIWTPSTIEANWTPDLVIIMDGNLPPPIKSWQCPTVVYGVDNHVRDYHQFDPITDHFFLAHGHGARMGEENVTWLPCGYDPTVFTPGPAWSERQWDAALIGVQYPARAELLYTLLTGLPGITIQYGAGAVYDQFAAVYQQSRISLVRSAAGDVAQRVWETAAMGCLIVMDQCADAEALGLVDSLNYCPYQSPLQAYHIVDWALHYPKSAEEVAQRGMKWAQSGTWDARLQVIIDWAEAQRPATMRRKKSQE